MVNHGHKLAVLFLSFFAYTLAASPVAKAFIPAAAPAGARAVVTGSGLDTPDISVTFTTRNGTAPAVKVARSATILDLAIPPSAISGTVTVASSGVTLATFPFTRTAEPSYPNVTTLIAATRAGDELKNLSAITVSASGTIYIADSMHHQIKALTPQRELRIVAGNGRPGFVNGIGPQAQFKEPRGIVYDEATKTLYVSDSGNHSIRKIAEDGLVTTLAGDGQPGFADGAVARFKFPAGLASDSTGLYVADSGNHAIRHLSFAGVTATVAGRGIAGLIDGDAVTALFNEPNGIALSPEGIVFVADTKNNAIRQIKDGRVTTIAGSTLGGFTNGPLQVASFKQPGGIAVNEQGDLLVADTMNHALRLVRLAANEVTTLAGSGRPGLNDGPAQTALFKEPAGIIVQGAIYVADTKNDAIRVLYPATSLTDLFPRRGPLAGGTAVRIFGTGFIAGQTQVTFGGTSAAVTFISSTELLATTPPNAAGSVDVRVTTPGGTTTLTAAYEYVPPPTLASIDPRKGPLTGGQTVTILGTNFDQDSTALIGGVTCPTITWNNTNSLTVTTPSGTAGFRDVVVQNAGGSVTLTGGYEYLPPPRIDRFSPMSGFAGIVVTIEGSFFSTGGTFVTFNGVRAITTGVTPTQVIAIVPAGATTGIIAVTALGGTSLSAQNFTVPVLTAISITPPNPVLEPGRTLQLTATGTYSDVTTRDLSSLATWTSANTAIATAATTGLIRTFGVGTTTIKAAYQGIAGSTTLQVRSLEALPPDPATVAPPINPTVPTTVGVALQFLYTGPAPIQTGVAAATINPERSTLLRGTVKTTGGLALPGVRIHIADHPEFGQTLSRIDGVFDIVVNGGGPLNVVYEKSGYVAASRLARTHWNEEKVLDDVVIVPYDDSVTTITSNVSAAQVARGSIMTDASGTRRATILFPPGVTGSLVLPDGSQRRLSTLNVRATEFTVGPSGMQAMPAELPAFTGYTYCVELSADEAQPAGASSVSFSRSVYVYLENFIGFPVGGIVPSGYYDRKTHSWNASENGRIIKILRVNNGLADIDSTGSGNPDDGSALTAIGMDDAERQQLATLYSPGQSLWRVPVTHFTPFDFNWLVARGGSVSVADGAVEPTLSRPELHRPINDPCQRDGSIIDCQNQTLGESIPITGTPFTLDYNSGRVARYPYKVDVPVSETTYPKTAVSFELEIDIAGRRFEWSYAPAANITQTFIWDGKDAYGREVQGGQEAKFTVRYLYPATYSIPAGVALAFSQASGIPSTYIARSLMPLTQSWTQVLGHFSMQSTGFGGWTLSPHHVYDGGGRIIYEGGGAMRTADPAKTANLTLNRVAGNGHCCSTGDGDPATDATLGYPVSMAFAPDGSYYIGDQTAYIRRVNRNGIIETVAGDGTWTSFAPDGAPALGSTIGNIWDIAVGPDGTVFFNDGGSAKIRKIVDGRFVTVAGNGTWATMGDGGAALAASIRPQAITVGPDGVLYIADQDSIRRVSRDGIIVTVADDVSPLAMAIGPDNSIYYADGVQVWRITPEGDKQQVTGGYYLPAVEDGMQAMSGRLTEPWGIAVAPDRTVIVGDLDGGRVRAIAPNGIITTLAGDGTHKRNLPMPGMLARGANVSFPWDVKVAPDGSLYLIDYDLNIVERADAVFPAARGVANVILASRDGTAADVFGTDGRHHETRDTLTGAVLYSFGYDSAGRLTSVTDVDGQVTAIERDAAGDPTAIVAPGGQRTTFSLTAGKLAAITNAANERYRFSYDASGLLSSLTTPRAVGAHEFRYDTLGRVIRDQDPAGGFLTLTSSGTSDHYFVLHRTAEGRSRRYEVETLLTGSSIRINTGENGLATRSAIGGNGVTSTVQSDGTAAETTQIPDSRFGMQAPMLGSLRMTNGSHTSTVNHSRSVTLTDPQSPLTLATMADTTSVNGRTWTSSYTRSTNTIETRSPLGRSATTTIDAKGRPVSANVPGIAPSFFRYTAGGLLESEGQDTRQTSFVYNAKRELASVTDPLHRTVGFEYDNAGRVTKQTLPDTRVITFTYDADGNMTSITPPSRPSHGFTFTPVGLEETYTPPTLPKGSQTFYQYNKDHQLTLITRPDGGTITPRYDTAGRLDMLTTPSGFYRYGYDATGKLESILASDGANLAYNYDGSLLARVTWSGEIAGNVGFTYDDNFRLTAESANGTTINYAYDDDDLLTSAGSLTLGRDAQNGLLTSSTLGAISDTWNYNTFGEPVAYATTAAGSDAFRENFVRDDAGRITAITESRFGMTFTKDFSYDAAGRLHEVSRNGAVESTYEFDENSNRRTKTTGGVSVTATYDPQDRMLTYGDATYAYSVNGELQTKTDAFGVTGYTYDTLGNLTRVVLPNGRIIDYVIDGQNRRIGRKVDGILVQGWLYANQLQIVAETNGSGAIVKRFVYATRSNIPDYMITSSSTYRIVSDHLGSPRYVLDSSTGAITASYEFDEFGNLTQSSNGQAMPFGFAGGLYDADTKLVRFGARDYDSYTARWTRKDPIGFGGGDSNIYEYVMGDPINRIDPSGLSWKSAAWCFGKGAVVGAAAAVVVGAVAVGAVSIGAPVAAVTATLGGLAIVGVAVVGGDVGINIKSGNWDGLAYDVGTLVGGEAGGAASGRAVAEGINGVPSGPFRWNDSFQNYQKGMGTIGDWLATGPNVGSAALSDGTAGAGAAAAMDCGC